MIKPTTHGIPETATQDRGRLTCHSTRHESNGRSLEDSPPLTGGGMKSNSTCIKNFTSNNETVAVFSFVYQQQQLIEIAYYHLYTH